MRSTPFLALATGIALALATPGCAVESETPTTEDALGGVYVDAGADLGRATHVIADVDGSAAFVVYDNKLERRTSDGTVTALGRVEGGFEKLVVSKKYAAWVTSSFVNGGGTHVMVHVLSRADAWKEVRTEDLSTLKGIYRHALAFLDDDTLAVGSDDKVVLLASDGTKSYVGGYMTKFRADEVFSIYPTGDAAHFYAALDNGELYDVETKTNTVTLQPKMENEGGLATIYDAKTKTWISTDFEGVKVFGLDGKLLRRADLVTQKSRYISAATLMADGKLIVSHQTESSQDRSVVAIYDLKTMKRTEVGAFDGIVDQLGTVEKKLFFAFSPKGAAGFNSRVWYAHSRDL